MFLLDDLPTRQIVANFSDEYGPISYEQVSLFLELLRSGSDFLSRLDAFLSHYDLSHGRWITLILLRREKSLSARPMDLAEKQGISRATMTGLIQGLEKQGLVSKTQTEGDKRGAMICLTEAGEAKLEAIMPVYYQRIAALTADISEDDIATTLRVLGQLKTRANQFSEI